MRIDVSHGEVLDKISILEIKLKKIQDEKKLEQVVKEMDLLLPCGDDVAQYGEYVNELYKDLSKVNNKLWEVEDEIRILERERRFDKDFIFLARKVYKFNDIRAKIKAEINRLTDSEIKEVKSYEAT